MPFTESTPVTIHTHGTAPGASSTVSYHPPVGPPSNYAAYDSITSLGSDQFGDAVLGTAVLSGGKEVVISASIASNLNYNGFSTYPGYPAVYETIIDNGVAVTQQLALPSSFLNAPTGEDLLRVVPLTGGDFVVAEEAREEQVGTKTDPNLYFELFDSSGNEIGSVTRVNASGSTHAIGINDTFNLVPTSSNGFVIEWDEGNDYTGHFETFNVSGTTDANTTVTGQGSVQFHDGTNDGTDGLTGNVAVATNGNVIVATNPIGEGDFASANFAIYTASGTTVIGPESFATAEGSLLPNESSTITGDTGNPLENSFVQPQFVALPTGGFLAVIANPTGPYVLNTGFPGFNMYLQTISATGVFGKPELVETTTNGSADNFLDPVVLSNGDVVIDLGGHYDVDSVFNPGTFEVIDPSKVPANISTLVAMTPLFPNAVAPTTGVVSPTGADSPIQVAIPNGPGANTDNSFRFGVASTYFSADNNGGVFAALQSGIFTGFFGYGTLDANLYAANFDPVAPPVVSAAHIAVSGATGTGGDYKIGDTVTATWNDSAAGDNNSATITGVTFDFSQFGGGTAVAATNVANVWTATYTITSGSIDSTNRNVEVTASDSAGPTTTSGTNNVTVDDKQPVVTTGHISVSGATGTGGAFKIGDTVTAIWNDSATGDNNTDTINAGGVTVNFSQFGGGAAVAATNSGGMWTATYTVTAGSIDTTTAHVAVTAADHAGNATTASGNNVTFDDERPIVTAGNISVSGATGAGGAFKAGDTVTATWNDSGTGDNNTDTINAGVTFNFSQFGGSAVVATDVSNVWTATYTVTAGSIDTTTAHVAVTATDHAGNATTTSGSAVAVDNEQPIVTAGPNLSGTVGVPINGTLVTFTDPAIMNPTAGDFSVGINWGDGTPLDNTGTIVAENGGVFAVEDAHTYTEKGSYQISVTVTDGNQAAGTAIDSATVSAASPTLTTTQQPTSATVGAAVSDEAILAGGFNPTGTITFDLYNNANGTGIPLFTDTEALVGGIAASGSYITTVTGTDYWVATYSGDSNNNSVSSGAADEPITITPATPTLATQQQPIIATVGTGIADQAIVSGWDNPTGTVTFNLYNNANGTGIPLFTSTEALMGGSATSASYTATATGTDYWVATYSGDSNNSSVSSGAADEPITITPATPTVTTSQQPSSATVGTLIADWSTVSGGDNPTGTVTFNLYNNANGSGVPLFTDTEALVAGTATSGSYIATTTGIDYWVATYNGDSNNNSVSSATDVEPVTVTPGTPNITTSQQPASDTIGGAIADQATVSGGFNPTGTVTFNLYNNPNGSGTALFTDANVLLINGVGTSSGYLPTATGTDYWVATYNGDSNNNSVSSAANVEPVTVVPATPNIATSQQPASDTVGAEIADQATVSGGFNPTGTVTFDLYNNPNGTGTPLFTDANVALINGVATSTGYSTTAIGTDYWIATYNGDSNNNSVTSGIGIEPVTVDSATPALSTPNVTGVTLGPSSVTLTDTANLESGYNPTGTITFALYYNGDPTAVDTETVSVSANGTYTTPTGYTLPNSGTVTGTYQWDVSYTSGSPNNNNVSHSNDPAEKVAVTAATPTLAPSITGVTLSNGGVTLSDSATLAGGYDPTGTIIFMLTSPSGATLDTESVTANNNGTYSTPSGYTLPFGGAIAGAYSWVATYSGDTNNGAETASPAQTTPTPTMTAVSSNINATASQTFGVSSLFTASANLPILSYEVEDESTNPNNGFWVLNGAVLPNGQITTLSPAQLSELSFVAGFAGTPVLDTLEVAASDAAGLGLFTIFTVAASAHASTTAPTVTTANELQAPNQTLTPANLFSATAFGGNSVASYEVEDTTTDSGHWVFNGIVEPTNQLIDVTAAQLSELSFSTGYGADALKVRANDGSQWSNVASLTVTPPPNAAPPAATASTLIMERQADGALELYNIGRSTIQLDGPLGQINPTLQVSGVGGFDGSDTTDLLMRDPATGAFTLYDVSNNNITGNVALGQVGTEWQVAGFGDFSGNAGETDMLMRSGNTGAFEAYDIANNAITHSTGMGQVGLEWQVAGFGDFSGNANETDMLMRNSNTGGFEVYDISNNAITFAAPMGQVGLEWQVAGFGDFSGRAGETDMLMRSRNTGAFEVYDISHNAITSSAAMGQVGLEWQIAGLGDFSGNTDETDMLMRNSDTGAFELYDISNNTITLTTGMGQVGLEWSVAGSSNGGTNSPPRAQLSGIAVDPAATTPSSATNQLTQAMASFAPSAGTTATASLAQAPGPEASNTISLLAATDHPQPIS